MYHTLMKWKTFYTERSPIILTMKQSKTFPRCSQPISTSSEFKISNQKNFRLMRLRLGPMMFWKKKVICQTNLVSSSRFLILWTLLNTLILTKKKCYACFWSWQPSTPTTKTHFTILLMLLLFFMEHTAY